MLIVFFIVTFLLMIVVFPFKIRLMSHFNLINLKGFYCFKFWRIKLLCGKILIDENNKIEIKNSNNIFDSGYDKEFVKKLSSEFLDRMSVKKFEIFFTGGLVDDSYTSAILCGAVSSFVQSLYSYLSQKYDSVQLYEDVSATFNETNMELTFDIVVSISFLQIILSLLKVKKLKKKENA